MLKLPVFKFDHDGREIRSNDTLRSIFTYATYHVLEVQDDRLLVEMQTFRSYRPLRREYPAPDGSLYQAQARDLPVSIIQQSYIYVGQGYQIETRKKGGD